MLNKSICPVCGSLEIRLIKKIEKFPAIVFPITQDIINSVPTKDLEIFFCENCSHQYQNDIDLNFNTILYTEYYKYYPYSGIECFSEHYRKPFEKIFESFVSTNEKKILLEVGVSDSSQLNFFNKFNFDAYGITPQSTDLSDKIISSFYEDYNFNMNFDVIISRFNLEHIVDLNEFLKKVNSDLKEDGLFFVQVPNTEYFMKNNILNFYAHEHIHYFNVFSLSKLFEKYEFLIEKIYHMNSPSIIIVGRKVQKNKIDIEKYFDTTKNISKKILEKINEDYERKIFIYGASLSLTEILYYLELNENISNKIKIIDDNPIVSNMFMPMFDIPIISYDKNLICSEDIVILTLNAVYHDNILSKIRADGLMNDIYAINNLGLCKL
ncbi:methyltransferase [Campylobacter hyointestinalis subsp. lawsonii CCUG 27631]|uniref:class I SAM-dependent methyltransferase n=1 Tax=Campylobacter hyointestinalis TaxID=198 RepID=UPI0007C96733|nr:class I SAM-dependent methyltransferase [Campylobacter hyointestinalis]ANE33467.1 methyltransferase [Campylobacter hyointestinalis subsp. lawsonii CCUG 27631]